MSTAEAKDEADFESGKRKREEEEGVGSSAEDDATKKIKSEENSEAHSSSFVSRIFYPLNFSFLIDFLPGIECSLKCYISVGFSNSGGWW